MATRSFAAVDLGAASGRVVLGRLARSEVTIEEIHRFATPSVRRPTGLHWDVDALFSALLTGVRRAASAGALDGIGIDSWGVDYALMLDNGELANLPFHYRDRRTAGAVARAHALVGRDEMYDLTGIQTMPINTVFQLLTEPPHTLERAERLLLISDLMAYRLSGELANESTAASTTGLVDARSGGWSTELAAALGLPVRPFAGELVEPGTVLSPALAAHHGCAGVPVHAVAGHDTASAFVPLPLDDDRAAVLVSGTWSLLGVECDEPVLSAAARAANVTNERGAGGRVRLLRNVMGLWLVQECRRAWSRVGAPRTYAELHRIAATATGRVALFDPDDERFLGPGDMPARIATACRELGQPAPVGAAEMVRSILASLACRYRAVLDDLELVTGRSIERLHLVGGGARDALLCRLVADMTGRQVVAGPAEASAAGNVLIQAVAAGELSGLDEARAVAERSFVPTVHEPGPRRQASEELYARFRALTGGAARDDRALA